MSAIESAVMSSDDYVQELLRMAEAQGPSHSWTLNRRSFLKLTGVAGGGLVLAFYVGERAMAHANGAAFMPNAFLRIAKDAKVQVAVPVSFQNEEASPGLKRGGVLNIVRHELELVCDADKIPDEIAIDVTGFDVGDSIHISNVALPKGVESAITDRDFTIATIVAPSALKSSDGDTTKDEGEGEAEGGEEA